MRRGLATDWETGEGSPSPLGVTFVPDDRAYNFAIYSKHAIDVRLLLFTAGNPGEPHHLETLSWNRHKSGRIWHCRVGAELVERCRFYAYSVDGPHVPNEGHRFDPDKILLDPYARAIHFPPDFDRAAACRPGSNSGRAPLGVLPKSNRTFDWADDRPRHYAHDAIIYELHVRGFTKRANSGVATAARRGTYAGLIDKIPYLKELGVTIIELLPVFQIDPQEGNYWGYMPMSFFALHNGYGIYRDEGSHIEEFKELVKALHEAGLEVILDVVYNHTAEAGENGPTYSFRGIDNTTYYLLESDRSRYRNDSGTGNVLHTANRYVRGLVLDSLRYWAKEMHVDGFRFDLASLFTRNEDGSINLGDPPIISAMQSDPLLSRCRMIAEAWDLSSYQLGRTFPGLSWLQWNGRFRDDVRRFVRGDAGLAGNLMTRLYGSDDLFPDTLEDAFHAFQSVNFVASHDGFSLHDLLAYDHKHNEANGEGGHDGTDANYSSNCGWEGEDGASPDVLRLRLRQAKNFIALLLLANGTPMIVAGDEFLNTQRGNNNPYNQDNETTWLDWDRLAIHAGMFRFTRMMIAFRKAHPTIARSRFWRDDITWYGPQGGVDTSSSELAYLLRGASQGDDDLYVMINGSPREITFAVQSTDRQWRIVANTAAAEPFDIHEAGNELIAPALFLLAEHSVVVLRCLGHPSANASHPVRRA